MDVGKSFTYMFEDKDWISKIAIGGLVVLLSIFIIPLPLAIGYVLRVTKNVAEGNPTPLPEWNDIGGMFMQGLMAILGAIIWFVPVIILACCFAVSIAVVGGAGGNGDSANSMAGLLSICFNCLIIGISVVLSFFIYAPITRFALNNQFETFWDFRGAWQFIKANPGNYVIAFLIAIVANFIAGFGVIACVIGVFFTTFWSYLVTAHIFGQVARANMPPMDSTMLPPSPPPMEPPSMMQEPIDAATGI